MANPAHADQGPARRADIPSARRFLAFRSSGRPYALPTDDVAEVILVPTAARLPHSPKSLIGLANLRGTVIPLLDLGVMLGQETFTGGNAARAIVLGGAGTARLALAVDMVDRLVELEAGKIETAGRDLAADANEILLGAFQIAADQTVTKILDVTAMLGIAFGERAPTRQSRAGVTPAARADGGNAATVDHRLLIAFEVSGQCFALPVDAIREIIPLPQTISPVPRAEVVLLGVTAWRDTLLPLLSLRGLLGMAAPAAWTGAEKVLVTLVNGTLVGLVADRARALIRADEAAIDPAPPMLAARSGGESKIAAIYRDDGGKRLISLLAPELLFREDVMRRIGDTLPVAAPASAEPSESATLQFVVFRLGSEEFGLPIGAVDEVALVPDQLARVPKMPKFLKGVINLRGEVLPVVDQRLRFEMPAFSGGGRQRLIVVRTDRHRAGLIVDSVSEVLRTPAASIGPPPDLTGEGARLVNGVVNMPGRMILLLEPGELLTRAEHGVLDKLELPAGTQGT
jgi:purine-binding chemotaxis protein CheW